LISKFGYGQDVWLKMKNSPYHPVRNNDMFIVKNNFWVVNGSGKIFKSIDSGKNWNLIYYNPVLHFRSIVFIDSLTGFCSNVGTGVFLMAEDTTVLIKY
jgi:hypothetical protein